MEKIKNKLKKLRIISHDGKYKSFLTIFYGFVFLVSLRGIIITVLSLNPKINQLPLELSFSMYFALALLMIIVFFSIISIFLVLAKKLPKANLIFPIYYLLLILVWVEVIPKIISMFADSIEDYVRLIFDTNRYWVIFSVINSIYSGVFLWKLWVWNNKKNEKFK